MHDARMPILIGAMALVVLASNILVQYPFEMAGLGSVLTWGAFSYPFAFLVTDLSNRWFGPAATRRVVAVGFVVAVALSLVFADMRIAVASGAAFLSAQLLDIAIFDRLRSSAWWKAPLVSTFAGSALDTAVFFSLAFAGTDVPWVTLALGDFAVKVLMALVALGPYAGVLRLSGTRYGATA